MVLVEGIEAWHRFARTQGDKQKPEISIVGHGLCESGCVCSTQTNRYVLIAGVNEVFVSSQTMGRFWGWSLLRTLTQFYRSWLDWGSIHR